MAEDGTPRLDATVAFRSGGAKPVRPDRSALRVACDGIVRGFGHNAQTGGLSWTGGWRGSRVVAWLSFTNGSETRTLVSLTHIP
jgi:hypothetical protein